MGDVGYATPTVNIHVATACVGNVGHSWQNVAFSNSSIGDKGMITAAKVLAHPECQKEDPEFDAWCDIVIKTIEKAKEWI